MFCFQDPVHLKIGLYAGAQLAHPPFFVPDYFKIPLNNWPKYGKKILRRVPQTPHAPSFFKS